MSDCEHDYIIVPALKYPVCSKCQRLKPEGSVEGRLRAEVLNGRLKKKAISNEQDLLTDAANEITRLKEKVADLEEDNLFLRSQVRKTGSATKQGLKRKKGLRQSQHWRVDYE